MQAREGAQATVIPAGARATVILAGAQLVAVAPAQHSWKIFSVVSRYTP